MAGPRKFVSTEALHGGMRVEQTITDSEGNALVQKGAFLDDHQIQYLRTKGIGGIYVAEVEMDPEVIEKNIPDQTKRVIEANRVEDRSMVTLSESVKEQVGEGISAMFADPNGESFIEHSQNVSKQLTDCILQDNAIAIDLGRLKISDEYTFRHSVDVATISVIIAKSLGFPQEALEEIGVAGLLHDMGKAKIPPQILNKPGRLDDAEFALMKQHTLFGYQILKEKGCYSDAVMKGVLQHHEKMGGTGYPLGLTSDKIHPYAKVISVADVYDALVTKRPYKDPFPKRDAIEIIMSMTAELDYAAMKAFLHTIIVYPVDSIVALSTGEMAKVVENSPEYPLRPKVVGLDSGLLYDLSNDIKCASMVIMT